MKILFTTHAKPEFLPDVMVDPDEVVGGPHYNNLKSEGGFKYINLPSGLFDIQPFLAEMPEGNRPDTLLIHADATLGCIPSNLPENTQSILLVGDTHHLNRPIQNLVQYAVENRFDAVIVWNRQHAHFFKEAGCPKVFWIPGLCFSVPFEFEFENRKNQLSFFGQLGDYHPRRVRGIAQLQKAGVALVGGKLPRYESLQVTAESLSALNLTLNSEWNLRVFETTKQATMLFNERLSHFTGLELFYMDGDAMVYFDSTDDLIEKLKLFLQNPELCQTIGKKGNQISTENFSFEARWNLIEKIINGEDPGSPFNLDNEPRCGIQPIEPDQTEAFQVRMQIYEWIQEMHRLQDRLSVVLTSSVHPLIISDLADLVRLSQRFFIGDDAFLNDWKPMLAELDVQNVSRIDSLDEAENGRLALITSVIDLEDEAVQQWIREKRFPSIIIWDQYAYADLPTDRTMVETGYRVGHHQIQGLYFLDQENQ